MLKEARKQSGASWNNQRCMIEAEPAIWNNIITPRSSTPNLFLCLRPWGNFMMIRHTAEGTYNFTSTQPSQHLVITQIESDQDELGNTEIIFPDYEDTFAYQGQDDTDVIEDDNANVERLKEMSVVAAPRNKEEKEPKKQMKSVGVEGLMERYLDMRTKQTEDEAAQLAREKEAHLTKEKENNDFSIKKCIFILNSMVEVTKEEKAKAYTVFKNGENREIFVSACEEDAESALIWLRNEMA
uniref:Uncharacterized protein n=1 Tax=Oryza punctata TaxID=4537 RepID=A0A0E0JT31_ORYPU